jgi:hypothetical protein
MKIKRISYDKKKIRVLLILFFLNIISPIAYSIDEAKNDDSIDGAEHSETIVEEVDLSKETNTSKKNEEKKNFFNIKIFSETTKIKDPFNLRDPFKIPLFLKSDNKSSSAKIVDGSFSNIPTIDSVPVSDIIVTGVLVGKERRAIATIKGTTDTVILREGMLLGPEAVEIKAIYPGGIVLVEKIINVYGQEEYLETIMPIQEIEVEDGSSETSGNKDGTKPADAGQFPPVPPGA